MPAQPAGGRAMTSRPSLCVRGAWLGVCLAVAASTLDAADCNLNGVEDDDDIAAATSADCNEDGIPDECQGTPIAYRAKSLIIPAESRASAVVMANANGDDSPDIVLLASAAEGSLIRTWTSDPSGELTRAETMELSARPSKMATGDVNGDGYSDLVVWGSFGAIYLENNAGEGESFWREESRLELSADPRDTSIGDVNGDGFDDVLINLRRADFITFFAGGPDGLGEGIETPVKDAVTMTALGEFTGDEFIDVAAVSTASDDVTIYAGDGAGRFTEGAAFPVGERSLKTLIPTDWDGDGDLDFVVVTTTRAEVYLGDGAGGFTGSTSVKLDRATGAKVFDADLDGDLDIALTLGNDRRLGFLRGDSEGEIESFADSGIFTTTALARPASADINRDGVPDIVAVTDGLVYAESRHDAPPVRVLEFEPVHYPISLAHWGAVADFDGDGDEDVAAAIRPPSIAIFMNDGTGKIAVTERYSVPDVHLFQIGDFEPDGDVDIFAPETGTLLLNNGQGRFTRGPTRFRSQVVTPIDLDLDGERDIVASGPALGTYFGPDFQYEAIGRLGVNGWSHVVRDLTGDGLPDIAVVTGTGVVLNEQIESRKFVSRNAIRVGGAFAIASADFDGDGDPDLAATDFQGGGIHLIWNQGAGLFELGGLLSTRSNLFGITPLDVDGDGRIDIVGGSVSDSAVRVLLNSPGGEFLPPILLQARGEIRWAGGGDLDGDGRTDVVATNRQGNAVSVFLNRSRDVDVSHLEKICTAVDFGKISIPVRSSERVERLTKFTAPARAGDPALLPVAFQNVWQFDLHLEFLRETFPERFDGLTFEVYEQLVSRRATRDYFIGNLYQLRIDSKRLYGFHVITGYDADARELPRRDEVAALYAQLEPLLPLGELVYFPADEATRENAESWGDVDFPVVFEEFTSGVEFIPYTSGVAYGRVRVLDADGFRALNEAGGISFQEILVLERSPRDIEGVIGGVITGEPQGELSHLAIRTARRGTPNAFVRNAAAAFAAHDGELVRLEVTDETYTVGRANVEEAERWWRENRKQLSVAPEIDLEYSDLTGLEAIAAQAELGNAVRRFGGKATNFAVMQTVMTGEFERYRARGFAIPIQPYLEFMESNRIPSYLDEGREVSYAEYVAELLDDNEFRTSPAFRFDALKNLREHIENESVVDGSLVRRIALKIATEFGSTQNAVRFRSSSNVEDALEFNGAGLYASTSGCAADDLDADANGPSHCDAARRDERGVARALRIVWASLWNFRAFEEREFFSVPQDRVGMGILVSRAFSSERANGVAFTGNPLDVLDERFIITAQIGERSVVSPEPGEIPEKTLLSLENGEVIDIERSASSSLTAPGESVLDDEQLRELGRLLSHLEAEFPLDLGDKNPLSIMLDVEFKIDQEGALAVKQVRPFLSNAEVPPTPTLFVDVPEDLDLCGAFVVGRKPQETYELKSRIRLPAGEYELPTTQRITHYDLVESVEFGPERVLGEPASPGRFRFSRIGTPASPVFEFDYEQSFLLPDGRELILRFSRLRFGVPARNGAGSRRTLSDLLASGLVSVDATLEEENQAPLAVEYRSCTYDTLPLWHVEVLTEEGPRFRMTERFAPVEDITATGPAALVKAELILDAESEELMVVEDYWRLVYTAGRHNLGVRYWVLLDEPVPMDGLPEPVAVVEIAVPDELFDTQEVFYLNEQFARIGQGTVTDESRRQISRSKEYVRGDTNIDGRVNLADAMRLLGHLFQGEPAPQCQKTADANDDESINLSDAISILQHLFGGVEMPSPSICGPDPTPDLLGCTRYVCRN